MAQTDEALMEACVHGDETAFDELVRRYADTLFGYLMRMTCNREDAEDLFQETFLKVHAKARTFRRAARFKPWLFAIATNAARDVFRRRKRRREIQTVSLDDCCGSLADDCARTDPCSAGDPVSSAERVELKEQVREAIDQLAPRQRTALLLAYYEDLSYREVANVMRCSVGTVKTHMSRALRKLALLLPEPEGAET